MWCIYLHVLVDLIYMVNVGRYTRPMDPNGCVNFHKMIELKGLWICRPFFFGCGNMDNSKPQ